MNRRQWFGLAGCPFAMSWLSACGAGHNPSGSAGSVTSLTEQPVRENLPERSRSVEVLLFDVFGTVVDWRASLISQFEQFGQLHGLRADWKALAIQWESIAASFRIGFSFGYGPS
jgi:hypothetical protein